MLAIEAFLFIFVGMSSRANWLLCLFIICTGAGCANITSPSGGKRDKVPPKLVAIFPADSLLNTRPKRIELNFDEYITVNDAIKEVQMSPILAIQPTVTGLNKHVVVKIQDTLLEDNTTYRLSFGSAIRDVHEANVFAKYTYTFSTGKYFDSLQLAGTIINAVTGFPDSTNMVVELYSSKDDDTAVSRHKPKYVTRVDGKGNFVFKGLPRRNFRIYALRDANSNLTYDGPVPGDWIGFTDSVVTPGDAARRSVTLRVFPEIPDTAAKKSIDSLARNDKMGLRKKQIVSRDSSFSYSVNIDTGNIAKRTFDINKFIKVSFNKPPVLNKDKIRLTYDSADVTITPEVSIETDSAHPNELHIKTDRWAEDVVYTLRLAKGFAKDTSGKELMPSKYVFRTNNEDDYGKIKVNLPAKYGNSRHLLLVASEKDTIYYKPVSDTIIHLERVNPAKYTFRIIVDKNGDGVWNTGDLLGHLQPEEIIPYPEPLNLKPGWENIIDFEQKPRPKMKDKRDFR